MRSTATMTIPDAGTRRQSLMRPTRVSRAGSGGYHPAREPTFDAGPDRACWHLERLLAGQIVPPACSSAQTTAPAYWRGIDRLQSPSLPRTAGSSAFWCKDLAERSRMLIGLWIAWNNYIRNPGAAAKFVAIFPQVHQFVFNKWYFDELYDHFCSSVRRSGSAGCSLAPRRRANDRSLRPARRSLCRKGIGNQCHLPMPDGLSLFLRFGHAARPDRGCQLGDLVGQVNNSLRCLAC